MDAELVDIVCPALEQPDFRLTPLPTLSATEDSAAEDQVKGGTGNSFSNERRAGRREPS